MPLRSLPVGLVLAAAAAAQATATVVATPLDTYGARLAVDAARHRIVHSVPDNPTWEHDGDVWVQRDYTLPAGVVIYDGLRERLVVVGESGVVACDGFGTTAIGPPLAARAAIVDTARARIVAVAYAPGGGGTGLDLVEFDGTAWSVVAPIPGNSDTAGIAFDPVRGKTVLGIVRFGPPTVREFWEWDGSTLVGPLSPAGPASVLSYDPQTQQVLVGGSAGLSLWNGTALTPVTSNWEDQYGLFCLDEAAGLIVRSWGNALYAWTGSAWIDLLRTAMPKFAQALTYDPNRGRAVLLGALGPAAVPKHAEWDGVRWHEFPVGAGAPPTFYLHAQAYDAARGETIVFGGSTGYGGLGAAVGTTYAWNGTNWRLAASTGPAQRRGAAMTYDASRQRVVMCGGRSHVTQSSYFDHWEWDGTSWTLVAPLTPFAGWSAVLGYDPVRQRVVAHALNQATYELVGSSWTQVHAYGPILTYGGVGGDLYNQVTLPTFAWHAASQRLVANVLAGNQVIVSGWNGVDWQPVSLPVGLHADIPATGSMLASFIDLILVSDEPAAAATFGAGCGGSGTTTALTAFGRPVLGSALFHVDLRADARQALAAIGFGDSAVSMPLGGGCSLLVGGLFAALPVLTDTFGVARLSLAIPASPALRGAQLVAQGLVFDALSPGGLAFTQGVTLALGD